MWCLGGIGFIGMILGKVLFGLIIAAIIILMIRLISREGPHHGHYHDYYYGENKSGALDIYLIIYINQNQRILLKV